MAILQSLRDGDRQTIRPLLAILAAALVLQLAPTPLVSQVLAQSEARAGQAEPAAAPVQTQPETESAQAAPAAGPAEVRPAGGPAQGPSDAVAAPVAEGEEEAQDASAQGGPAATPEWNFFGDFRLRYEDTTKQEPGTVPGRLEPRHRGVVRMRGGVAKRVTDVLLFSARVATGASGDPNTTDVTLGDFVNDLEVSLDQVYLELRYRDFFLTGGKFANPFMKTPLLWDDDVNPQGMAFSYKLANARRVQSQFTGIYSIVDEQTVNPDSYMVGGQLQLAVQPSDLLNVSVSGAYYDYTIKSLAHADSGDIQSNTLNEARTEYLSDFNLVDVVGIVDYKGFSERHPVRVIANYVKNLGAAIGDDGAFSVDFYVGRVQARNDLRYRYGYSEAGVDAILAAFSHDDTTFATNYEQHSVSVDYVTAQNTVFNTTWYLYRRPTPGTLADGYISRLRVNFSVSF